jgi:hypothetical protein
MPAWRAGRTDVVFDDAAFDEDLERASPAGRAVALSTRASYIAYGCPLANLRVCEAESPDGIRLGGCAKLYLPAPAGRFGMVFALRRREGRLLLSYLAFGVRHHPRDSNAPTVYQLAHLRLHR